jgi:hypothetical protein
MRRYPHAGGGVLVLVLAVLIGILDLWRGPSAAFPWQCVILAALALLIGTTPPPDERGRTSARGWRRVALAVCFVGAILWLWSVERS